MIEFFESLGVDMELSDMSFAVSLDGGQGFEWGSRNGFSSLFAQKRNVVNPYFWQMVREIIKFKNDVIRQVVLIYAQYLGMLLDNNANMDHSETSEQFIKSKGYSELFVNAYLLTCNGCRFQYVVLYVYSDVFLHHDKNLMPQKPAAWSAMSFLGCNNNRVCVTHWLNVIQNLGETRLPSFATLNPKHTPENTLLKWSSGLPIPSVAVFKASQELEKNQGKRRIWFCDTYQGTYKNTFNENLDDLV
ncbi:hypothetical protein PIB30_089819 [Stylosanthes scabra]|uniref:Uncharacterized protein n=1 Tax=Stylosanthes scabra TaxID=79078 RepID=A0ABU6RU27_9FABA|nr:hypothetical protein [Stylosanthes scabra]